MSQSETHASPFQMVRDKHICSWYEMILHSSWNREGLAVTKCLGTIMLEKEKFIWLYVFRSFRVCWTWLLFGLFEVVHCGGRKLLTLWEPGNRDSGRAPDIPFKDPRSEIYFLPSRSNLLSFLPPPNTLLLVNQGFHWWDCRRGAILYPNCDK